MLSNIEDTHVVKLFSWLIELEAMDELPNNERRDLNDANIKRLMSEDVRHIVDNVKNAVYEVGFEAHLRYATVQRCKEEGFRVSWTPLEQDSFGWLSAKLVTKKGYIAFA